VGGNGLILTNFHLLLLPIVSGAVRGKLVGFYGGKSTGIFSFVFTILLSYDFHLAAVSSSSISCCIRMPGVMVNTCLREASKVNDTFMGVCWKVASMGLGCIRFVAMSVAIVVGRFWLCLYHQKVSS